MIRKSSGFRLSVIAFAACQFIAAQAYADDTAKTAELEKKLDQAMQQLKVLTDRINQLEAAKAQPAVATVAPDTQQKIQAQDERINKLEQSLEQAAAANADQSLADSQSAGVPLHGFISVGYANLPKLPSLPNTLNEKSGFQMKNVDFYMTPNFGDQLKALMEFNLEYTDQGVLTYDLERFEIGYVFNDLANVWVGRFHTPFGQWNTAYHHGHYIQTSIDRPRFIAFEDQGGVLPSHTVGVMESGTLRVNSGDRIAYDLFVGNGSRIIPASDGNTLGIPLGNQLEFNPVGDDNANVAFGGRASYTLANTLTLGLHALSETVNTYDANNVQLNSTQVKFYGGYYFLEWNNWESIGEYYQFKNKDVSGPQGNTGTHDSWAGYAQLSYTFNNIWTPYVRTEKAALDQTDYYFGSLDSGRAYTRNVAGIRWDFNKSAALKFEFDRTDEKELGGFPDEKYNRTRLELDAKF